MKRLAQPTAWRLMLAAFALWAVNFFVGYAAELIAPGSLATRLLLGALAAAGVALIVLIDRRAAGMAERGMVRAALLVAGLGILFNAATALA